MRRSYNLRARDRDDDERSRLTRRRLEPRTLFFSFNGAWRTYHTAKLKNIALTLLCFGDNSNDHFIQAPRACARPVRSRRSFGLLIQYLALAYSVPSACLFGREDSRAVTGCCRVKERHAQMRSLVRSLVLWSGNCKNCYFKST